MYCQRCQKRPATVHIVQFVNDIKTEQHLCSVCSGQTSIIFPQFNAAGNLLIEKFLNQAEQDTVSGGVCKVCGTSFNDFLKTGLLGCAHCYEQFEDKLEEPITRLHHAYMHKGKRPGRIAKGSNSVEALRKELEQAISTENYERAAIIRDIIKNMEVD